MAVRRFQDLEVWQKAMDLATLIYEITREFPSDERFGLTNQIRRSATSIPANIAEGFGRLSNPDYLRFLAIARGSLMETETHLLLAERLNYVNAQQIQSFQHINGQVGRLLNGLIRSLRDTDQRSQLRENSAMYEFSDSQLPTPDPHDEQPLNT